MLFVLHSKAMALFKLILRITVAAYIVGQAFAVRAADIQIIGAFNVDADASGEHVFATGWACQLGLHTPISIRLDAGPAAADRSPGGRTAIGVADMDSEPAVNTQCHDPGGKHRFRIALPAAVFASGAARTIDVHGVRSPGGVASTALSGSGLLVDPARWARATGAFNSVSGHYVESAAHPRVFTTSQDLADLVRRIETPGSYSSTRFQQLSGQVAKDLGATNRWDATFSGCDAGIYQYAFSYEPQDGQSRRVATAMKLPDGPPAPAGAAVVASRLALYGALIRAGATPSADGPSAIKAIDLSKSILLAWSRDGFRKDGSRMRSAPTDFCDDHGAPVAGVGLVVSRGVLFSVQAQDLLMSAGALDDAETKDANAFHAAMDELIRSSLNAEFDQPVARCDHFNNQSASSVAALLALARLLGDAKRFEAALNGGEPAMVVKLPWNRLLNGAIYGDRDTPNSCRSNTGPDGLSSKPFFESPIVASGEIDDRFRNLHPQQGIGYPMLTLEWFFDSGEVLRNAGFDGYGYRGAHGQSIQGAIDYYACFAKTAGFGNVVSRENSRQCPDVAQYEGKIVSGVDPLVLIAAWRIPEDALLKPLEGAAKKATAKGPFSLDAILFGKWGN